VGSDRSVADDVSAEHHADVIRLTKRGRVKWVQCWCGRLSLAWDAHERHLVAEGVAAGALAISELEAPQ
jgi:hypothetical protein